MISTLRAPLDLPKSHWLEHAEYLTSVGLCGFYFMAAHTQFSQFLHYFRTKTVRGAGSPSPINYNKVYVDIQPVPFHVVQIMLMTLLPRSKAVSPTEFRLHTELVRNRWHLISFGRE